MLNSPVDFAMVAGVILLIFGPKSQGPLPPWRWKVETNEKHEDRKQDPFRKEKPDSFLADDQK